MKSGTRRWIARAVPSSAPSLYDDPATTDNDMTVSGAQFLNIYDIYRSGTTATAQLLFGAAAINLPAGSTFTVTISGASNSLYNVTATATVVDAYDFTYTLASDPGVNATGPNIVGRLAVGGTLDDSISRLSALQDPDAGAGEILTGYQYLGPSTVIQEVRPQAGVDLSYIKQPGDTLAGSDVGDQYTGLDRFGRIVDQNWVRLNSPSTFIDRVQYGYDNDSNVLFRNDLYNTNYSQVYTYDSLNRLTGFTQGLINSTHNGITGSPTDSGTYTLDSVGNMTTYGSGSRTVNA